VSFQFNERIIGICGRNGKGKTNLLDAIYYCCFTKSYFTRSDAQNVLTGSQGFRVESIVSVNQDENRVVCIFREAGKRSFHLTQNRITGFPSTLANFHV
jgi:DNA replication and repair protein RecF